KEGDVTVVVDGGAGRGRVDSGAVVERLERPDDVQYPRARGSARQRYGFELELPGRPRAMGEKHARWRGPVPGPRGGGRRDERNIAVAVDCGPSEELTEGPPVEGIIAQANDLDSRDRVGEVREQEGFGPAIRRLDAGAGGDPSVAGGHGPGGEARSS